jgi:hypothetical protein
MPTPKPEISRKQAWCKLAVLIAEGLPAPQDISFNPLATTSITIRVDDLPAFESWVAALSLGRVHTPLLAAAADGSIVLHDAWDYWHGWHTRVSCTMPALDTETVAEDMDAVRAIATEADHCVCCTYDCGDRRGHGRNDRDGGDSCNCGRDWPCMRESW